MGRPSPFEQIRLVSLSTLRGANFWSSRPVTRLDVAVGAYEDISSATVPEMTDALLEVMPGLVEHRCSVGERGGLVTRLRRGTYAPHIVEHIALELQSMIGQEVGFGRARGGDRPGEYTVVFEHLHAGVGLRAAALALDVVQRAFAGEALHVECAVSELRNLAAAPDATPPSHEVLCGVVGGRDATTVRGELRRIGVAGAERTVAVTPAYLLHAGLPYARSAVAIILDGSVNDVPDRYRDSELSRRLLSVMADALPSGGTMIVPAGEPELHELIARTGRGVATFQTTASPQPTNAVPARARATVQGGGVVIEAGSHSWDAGVLRHDAAQSVQLACALAAWSLGETHHQPDGGNVIQI